MIVLVYLIVLLRELLVSIIFLHCASLYSVDTCYTFFALRRKCSYVHAHVNTTPRVI